MPKAQDIAQEGAPANDPGRLMDEAQRTLAEAARRIEAAVQVVQEGLGQLRDQSRVYADSASEHLEDASAYVSEQVRARPLVATGAAIGVGVLIGLLIAQATQRR